MQINFELPDNFKTVFREGNITRAMRLNSALIFYKQGRISISKASKLADMDIFDFIYECRKNEIPVIDYSEKELTEEYKQIKKKEL